MNTNLRQHILQAAVILALVLTFFLLALPGQAPAQTAADNQPPIADAGISRTFTERSTSWLNGGGSTDYDDVIADVQWTQLSGPSVDIHDPHSKASSFYAPDLPDGTPTAEISFKIQVWDMWGATDWDTVTHTVVELNVEPGTDAGPDQVVDEHDQVTLDGSGTMDYDDDNVSQQWTQLSGTPVTLSGADTLVATFTAPNLAVDEDLTFELAVTDVHGATVADTCVVTVTADNDAPVAAAGPDTSVDEGVLVTLNGLNSSDPDDEVAAYTWTQTAGPSVEMTGADTAEPSFTAPDVGTNGASLTFALTVADTLGLTDTDSVIVNVSWVNQAPTANAGVDRQVGEGETVTLAAGSSSDPDDGIASYAWAQTFGPAVVLDGADTASPTFTAPDVDTNGASLGFELTVTDAGGLEDTDKVIVNVSWINQAPTADAGPASMVLDEGQSGVLDGGNSTDPDDGIATYAWTQIAGPSVLLTSPLSATTMFTAPDVDSDGVSLTFELTVTDAHGLAASDTVTVNISWINQAPTAAAGPDMSVDERAHVTLDGGNSADPDDGIHSYAWRQISGPDVTLETPLSSTAGFTAPAVEDQGVSLVFELAVTDTGGLVATDRVTVSVLNTQGPPAADAGGDLTVTETGEVLLDGQASSADGQATLVSWAWTQIDGPGVTLTAADTAVASFTAPNVTPEGVSMTFELTVTDDDGLSDTDTMVVNVTGDNDPPVAMAGDDQRVGGLDPREVGWRYWLRHRHRGNQGETVVLDGSDSFDPDDGIKGYMWRQVDGPPVTLSDPMSPVCEFISPKAHPRRDKELVFELTVTDYEGLKGTDSVTVTVGSSMGCVFNPAARFGLEWLLLLGVPLAMLLRGRMRREG